MMPMRGVLALMRRWLGVEMEQKLNGGPHAAVTSPEERRQIDERIHRRSVELDMLLAEAALEHLRSRERRPDAAR
jgi:hypothetical protein